MYNIIEIVLSQLVWGRAPNTWHMEIPRLGINSKLQLLTHATATATRDQSRLCDLHHSSRQHQIPNPLSH